MKMKILISGAGIAGPTLAYWLTRYGFEPTIVEKSSRLRTGGYIIDFWGAGYEVADRMGLLPELTREGYLVEDVKIVDKHGKRIAGFPAQSFSRMTQGRYLSLPRGDLSASILRRIESDVEIIFGDSVNRIEQTAAGVEVLFDSGAGRHFDLVVGADGLHSKTRELVFGDESRFENYLGYKAAAFQVGGYKPRDELAYVMYTEIGQQIARFSMRDDQTVFLFTFADDTPECPSDVAAQKSLLRKRFGNSGWECPRILDALDQSNDLYFDRVSQIHMDARQGLWTQGRVMLLGDAAFCVSLLAGQGSALAMTAAYLLAGELKRAGGDYASAFAHYQERFAPFILRKGKAALRFAGAFAPKSRLSLFLRNHIMNLFHIPWVADMILGHDLADRIEIPNY